MKKHRQFWSIKQKLLFVISLLIFLSIAAVTTLTYRNYRNDLLNQSKDNTQLLLQQLSYNLETYLEDVQRQILAPYYSEEIMQTLVSEAQTPAQLLAKQRKIEGFLSEKLTLPRSDIIRAYIFCDDQIYSSKKTRNDTFNTLQVPDSDWYNKGLHQSQAFFFTDDENPTLEEFSIASSLQSVEDNQRQIGMVRLDLNMDGIKMICERIPSSTDNIFLLLDEKGQLLYVSTAQGPTIDWQDIQITTDEKTKLSICTIDGIEYLYSSEIIDTTGWKLVNLHSMGTLIGVANSIRSKSLILALVCVVFGVGLSIVLIRRMLRPINDITSLMKIVEQGNLSVQAQVTGNDELAYLATSFNEMVTKLGVVMEHNTTLTRQIYEAKYLQQVAQYTALYNQIKPHFLFNTLNTISLLIKCRKDKEAINCIEKLATLLTGMIHTDEQISVRSELRIVESYLSLQKERFGTLSYEIIADNACLDAPVPALLIQPVVENALIHGCEPKRGAAKVIVEVRIDGGNLIVTITDNGGGMPKVQLEKIQQALSNARIEPVLPPETSPPRDSSQDIISDIVMRRTETGIALINISQRIHLRYGEGFGLVISSEEGKGTRVTITLPRETTGGTIDV